MKKTIIKSTIFIFVLSLIGKIVGFINSIVMSSYFGANSNTDAYYFAQGIVSNILYMLTTSIGLSFLPIYISVKHRQGHNRAKEFSGQTIWLLSVIAIVITIIIYVISPVFIKFAAPSYKGEMHSITVKYLRIMSAGILFSLLTNIFQNLLNAEKTYGYTNISGIINSTVLISTVIVFSPKLNIMAAVIAIPASYIIQFLVLAIRSRDYIKLKRLTGLWNANTKVLIQQALPILFSNAAVEINQLIDRILLVSIGNGAVTAVNYAGILLQFASNILAIPISTVAFTEFSEMVAQKRLSEVSSLLKDAIHVILLLGTPVTLITFFYSTQIVNIVYGRGNYTQYAITLTASGLKFYAFCIIPSCIKQLMTRAFYSMEDTRLPMIISIGEIITNTVISIILARRIGLVGVVAGTAIASAMFCIVQIIIFHLKKIHLGLSEDFREYLKITIVTVVMSVILSSLKIQSNFTFITLLLHCSVVFFVYFTVLTTLREKFILNAAKKVSIFLKNRRGGKK